MEKSGAFPGAYGRIGVYRVNWAMRLITDNNVIYG